MESLYVTEGKEDDNRAEWTQWHDRVVLDDKIY
jgi:hypothetical protein